MGRRGGVAVSEINVTASDDT